MLEIKVTIACPDLPLAATALAAAINHHPMPASAAPTPAPAPAPVSTAPAPAPTANYIFAQAPLEPPAGYAPVAPIAAQAAPATPTVSSIPPTAPTAAPTYTIDQLAKAGAELTQAGKIPQLIALLQQFGVQTVDQLPQDRIGAFATALRGLGAKL